MKTILLAASALAVLAAAPSSALTIKLNDTGGAAVGTQAYTGFRIAAQYWERQFTNNVTVNLNIGFNELDPDVLGSASSAYWVDLTSTVQSRIVANANTVTATTAAANLPKLTNGALDVIIPGYNDTTAELGINARTRFYDNDGGVNNQLLGITTANAKALGLVGTTNTADAQIRFNSLFDFDFNPSDGIDGINFIQVALHEIGHALGFVSGVDGYDFFGCPSGPACASDPLYDAQNDWWGSSLDLYRYSANPTPLLDSSGNVVAAGPLLDWSIRNGGTDGAAFAQPYFSIDGGDTALFGNLLSRGQFNTNSYQASHFRSSVIAGQPYLGIMDAVGRNDMDFYVSALDIASFNVIGWQTQNDALLNPGYQAYTADIFLASNVPEPATWGLMIAGFGIVGAAARRRRSGYATA